jgi:hypothetical protein
MSLPVSPKSLSAAQIEQEFGRNSSSEWRISDYRKSTNLGGVDWPVDDGIPTSNEIKFSDFYGKQHNIVILMSGGDAVRQKILKDKTSIDSTAYRNTNSNVRKTSKNIVYVIKKIGSSKYETGDVKKYCALRTQPNDRWFGGNPNGARVIIRVGSGGGLYGAGGDGGKGGKYNRDGASGNDGSSALGIQVDVESVIVDAGGVIQAGGGGGGGGGGAKETSETNRKAGGGGGGGGAGYPKGFRGGAGEGNRPNDSENTLATDGNGGVLRIGGDGGRGGNNDGEARGGGGGGGGTYNTTGSGGNGGENGGGSSGDGGNGSGSNGEGGSGGAGRATGSKGEKESEGGSRGEGGYAITREGYVSQAPSVSGDVYGPVGQYGVS